MNTNHTAIMSTLEIKWKNHNKEQSDAYFKMLVDNKLTDCTLSAEGRCLSVHKTLLAAASPHFMVSN